MAEGEISPLGIARSRKKSLQFLLQEVNKFFAKEDANLYRIAVGCGYDLEEQKNFHQDVLEFLKKQGFDGELGAYQVGATIGVHTGPYPIGFGMVQKYGTI